MVDYSKYRAVRFEKGIVIGLDLGQKQDPSALALIERTKTWYDARNAYTMEALNQEVQQLVHAERLPLGTPYTEVVARVRRVVQAVPAGQRVALVVDATGVGGPVVDLLRRERLGAARLVPVTITSGEKVLEEDGWYRVPKRDIVTALQVAFEQRSLVLREGAPLMETFIGELMSMRATVTTHGHERVEAWRAGSHDDVVLAVGLAWWWVMRERADADTGVRFGYQPYRLL